MPADSAVYQARPFEQRCFDALSQNKWVVLLGPREHGKSSALVRLRARLLQEGFHVSTIDFQANASQDDTYRAFLAWFSFRLTGALEGATHQQPPDYLADDLESWLEPVVNQVAGSIVVLIDEAAALHPAIRTRFYSQLRAIYNARALHPTAWRGRISFLFSGTFQPEEIIAGDNSPFNVSEMIYTEDLTLDQARTLSLAAGGGAELEAIAQRAFDIVGGQPYLLQRLLDAASGGTDAAERLRLLESARQDIVLGRDRHVPSLMNKLGQIPGALAAAGRIAASANGIPYSAASALDALQVVGIAGLDGDRLIIRNEIYREVVLASPQATPEPPQGSHLVPLAKEPRSRFKAACKDSTLEELAFDSFNAGIASANNGDYRLALVGIGAAYEGMLLDFLCHRLSATELATSMAGVTTNGHPHGPPLTGTNPRKWKFVNMIDVAHNSGRLPFVKERLSDYIREWRNLVHPDNAAKNFQTQPALSAEVKIAVGVSEKLLQALEAMP